VHAVNLLLSELNSLLIIVLFLCDYAVKGTMGIRYAGALTYIDKSIETLHHLLWFALFVVILLAHAHINETIRGEMAIRIYQSINQSISGLFRITAMSRNNLAP